MSILLLGGTGFLGKALIKTLQSHNKDLVILTRNPTKLNSTPHIKTIVADLLDFSEIDLSPYQQIINCAGEIENENLMDHMNVKIPLHFLKQFSKFSNRHWIQISSVGVYGKPKIGLITEDAKHLPLNKYELTKSTGELSVKEFCQKHNVNYTIVRPSNVFGIGMPNQSLASLIQTIKKNRFFYMGNPRKVTMNYVSVDDVAHFIFHCLEHEKANNQEFIISDYLYLSEFVDIVLNVFQCHRKIYSLPENFIRFVSKLFKHLPFFPLSESRIDALTSRVIYSTEKAKEELDFKLSVGIKAGLKSYCEQFI